MVKLRDVAKLANVSISAVSRILANDETFSATQETIDKVNSAAEQLGYVTKTKQKMKSSTKKSISIITTFNKYSEKIDPFWSEIRSNVIEEASQNNFVINKVVYLDSLKEDLEPSDGYIFLGTTSVEMLTKMGLEPSNTVVVGDNDFTEYDRVVADLQESTVKIVQKLVENGHKNIGYVGGHDLIKKIDDDLNLTEEVEVKHDLRANTFVEQIVIYGLNNESVVHIGGWRTKDGYKLANYLLEKKDKPTSIIIANYPLYVGVMNAIQEKGLKVPEDISLICYGGEDILEYTSKTLTTVDLKTSELGRQAIHLIDQRLKGRVNTVKVIVGSKIIEHNGIKNLNKTKNKSS